jgi:hypothetical protein
MLGVGGMLDRERNFRFQKPAFGPSVTKANVQRESPRRVSRRWAAAVSKEASDITNASLISDSV